MARSTDNNRVSIQQEVHIYEEISLNEMVPDPDYEDVEVVSDDHPPPVVPRTDLDAVVSDDHPSPVVPRTDLDADGYLKLQGQGNDEHVYNGSVRGSDDDVPMCEDTEGYLRPVPESPANPQEDQRRDSQGYLKPVPSNHDAIESKYLTPHLPGATVSPYSTAYDHVPWWQKALRLKINKPK